MSGAHEIFVPGRLCLAGEHSDWAAARSSSPGAALVVGLQEGLSARARRLQGGLHVSSALAGDARLARGELLAHARSRAPWRYAAGVAHVVHARFALAAGLELRVTDASLAPAKGFSSSAAVAVLVARAYNLVYGLRLSPAGEMDLAYAGERLTGSACGRMDQIVAIGPGNAACMHFQAEYVAHRLLPAPARPLYFVLADLAAAKDTTNILAALQHAFVSERDPDARAALRYALGEGNLVIIRKMENAIAAGDALLVGAYMVEWQAQFDAAAITVCPEHLSSPVLHATLSDPDVASLAYGGKGVGSQGDGAVQFIAKDRESALRLQNVLREKLGTEPYIVTLGEKDTRVMETHTPSQTQSDIVDGNRIRTAVIPAAGFGTRLFPASRSIRPKALFPVVDKDGFAKPLLLCLVEECVQAGIERVIVVVGPGDQEERVREVFAPVSKDLYAALKPHMRDYADRIAKLEAVVEIAIQSEPNGFGHAVSCAGVKEDCPFALLLGDVLFRSRDADKSCLQQAIACFDRDPSKSVIGVTQVPLSECGQYGVVKTRADFKDDGESVAIAGLVEKPDAREAEECSRNGLCSIVLGPYIFTPALMRQLRKDVEADRREGGEIQLTSGMVSVHKAEGMQAVLLNGEALDTGNAAEYVRTFAKLGCLG